MWERNTRIASETLRIGLIILLQLLFSRLGTTRGVVDEEGQLLRQPPTHDDVIVFETQGTSLARKQLLVQVIRDQSPKFTTRWRTLPLRGPVLRKPAHVARADLSLSCLVGSRPFRRANDPGIGAEQNGTGQEKVN